jgi:non-canonical purine NTP pyrophosphatase (RdgB/HAM1 family)
MKTITFVTSNDVKFIVAKEVLNPRGYSLEQVRIDVPEIQDENIENIARDKAQKAFEIIKKPIIITDDGWSVPGLNGFPGPYMASVNKWFTSEDWLRLTKDLKDRRIFLHQTVVYQDDSSQHFFSKDIECELLTEVHAQNDYAHTGITRLKDGDKTIAEVINNGEAILSGQDNAYQELAAWLETRK